MESHFNVTMFVDRKKKACAGVAFFEHVGDKEN